jgi:hypothetical protein
VVAEFGPGGVGADFDAFDFGGPVLREEDVVDVVGAIFMVPEIVGGLRLCTSGFGKDLGFGKEMMLGAGEAAEVESRRWSWRGKAKRKRDSSLRRPTACRSKAGRKMRRPAPFGMTWSVDRSSEMRRAAGRSDQAGAEDIARFAAICGLSRTAREFW